MEGLSSFANHIYFYTNIILYKHDFDIAVALSLKDRVKYHEQIARSES